MNVKAVLTHQSWRRHDGIYEKQFNAQRVTDNNWGGGGFWDQGLGGETLLGFGEDLYVGGTEMLAAVRQNKTDEVVGSM